MLFVYNRESDNRVEYLAELLVSIYGTTNIKIDSETESAVSENSIFGELNKTRNNKTKKSMGFYSEKFKVLFELSLLDDSFEFKVPKSKILLKTKRILKNVQIYLQKIGVDFSEIEGLEVGKEKLRGMMYEAIVLYILPALFFIDYKDRNSKDHRFDIIGSQIFTAVKGIQSMIDSETYYIHRDNNITKVYDLSLANQEYNYKLPIEINSIVAPKIIELENKPFNVNCKNEEFLTEENQSISKSLLDGFIKVDPQEERIAIEKSINNTSYPVYISTMSYEALNKLQKDLEYYTYIDDDITEEYKTNAQLKSKIKDKAKRDIAVMFSENEKKYYFSIANYIEGALDSISKIDMNIFSNRRIGISKYKESLELFSSQAGKIINFYTVNYGLEQCKLNVKNIFIKLIDDFVVQLKNVSEQLVEKYNELLPQYFIREHKNTVCQYLYNNPLETVLSKLKKESSERYVFERLNDIVQNYYDLM